MGSTGCNLEGTLYIFLTFNIKKVFLIIIHVIKKFRTGIHNSGLNFQGTREKFHGLIYVPHTNYFQVIYNCSFPGIVGRKYKSLKIRASGLQWQWVKPL